MVSRLKDSIAVLNEKIEETVYFSLAGNEEAISYFDALGISNMADFVKESVYEYNLQKKANTLIPYEGMEGTFLINKVSVLNHKWIILDFSNGRYWGEVFLKYFVEDSGVIRFEIVESFFVSSIEVRKITFTQWEVKTN